MNKLFRLLLLVLFIPPWIFLWGVGQNQWKSLRKPGDSAMVKPGNTLGNMVITTGAEGAPSLWEFCSNSPEGKGSYILDCRVPTHTTLGIGNIFLSTGEPITDLEWSSLNWQLSIDGREVDLEAFGTVVPGLSQDPFPVRELLRGGTAWNIVLTGLEPGHHILWFVAQSKDGNYSWSVNLDIESLEGIRIAA